jgi:hypothetical protein
MYFFRNYRQGQKIEENNGVDDDVYILHVKRYAIRTCSGLER